MADLVIEREVLIEAPVQVLRAWPAEEKQRYADEHQGGWGEFLDRLAALVAKHRPG